MGKLYETITPRLGDWLARQPMFFVATAPTADDGLVNCSPKGMDTFRSCGYSVPRLEFVEQRDTLARSAEAKGPAALQAYRNEKNARSLDGLPALDPEA